MVVGMGLIPPGKKAGMIRTAFNLNP